MSPFSYIKDYSVFGAFGIVIILVYLCVITCFRYMKNGYKSFKSYLVFIIYLIFIIWLMITFKISIAFANDGWFIPFFISIIYEIFDYYKYKKNNE